MGGEAERGTAGVRAALVTAMPFAAAVGVRLDAVGPDETVGRLGWAPERCTAGGVMHGGALLTLADSAGAVCAFLGLPEGAATATTSSTAVLLRPVRSGDVTATARPLHRGRTSVVVQVDLRDDQGRLVAQVTQTQAVLDGAAGAAQKGGQGTAGQSPAGSG
jgi:1,4-dihydroxy-2-naphthoyl-CoA hydrolase